MPFLRRRGVMASESDFRRHAPIPESDPAARQPPQMSAPLSESESPDEPLAPAVSVETSASPVSALRVPAPPVTPPNDDGPSSSHGKMVSADPPSRPASPPVQDETPKTRRFSMLRFRNASDSQLSARLKQQQQEAEKPPPMPRRRCFLQV